MAKETDLKKIELKVSVNCCDGCKKRVKKALRSIEGVYKTEIDPLQPKVIVLGNVEPQTVIRKLVKAGKQAEIWSNENQKAGKEKDVEVVITKEQHKEESKSEGAPAKCSNSSTTPIRMIKESITGGQEGSNKSPNKDTNCTANAPGPKVITSEKVLSPRPEVTCSVHPSMLSDKGKARTNIEDGNMVESSTTVSPCYAAHSHQAPPCLPTCCSQEHYCHYHHYCYHGGPESQPYIQMPVVTVGEYFSDENTSGCNVM
ncbi:uncharacterized protein LOC127793498 [Diospyros lotus]|uniref:uncharacterized protein LOC127793498 n=1 Tax=Diospyros lotus TaxID=55363 RepID=UPI0022506E59|nr:uncharacterized protein LOC127793498 [Diospyros lotus]